MKEVISTKKRICYKGYSDYYFIDRKNIEDYNNVFLRGWTIDYY